MYSKYFRFSVVLLSYDLSSVHPIRFCEIPTEIRARCSKLMIAQSKLNETRDFPTTQTSFNFLVTIYCFLLLGIGMYAGFNIVGQR